MAGRIRPASRYTGPMTETTLYGNPLDIEPPWRVRDVRLALDQGDVEVGWSSRARRWSVRPVAPPARATTDVRGCGAMRFTALFEAMVIDWLKVASFTAVARQCRLSWDQVAGIQGRAVRRGLSRRPVAAATAIGVDETSFQRRHEYVTVVNAT